MAVRQMTEPQIAKWSRAMENQGVKVTRTKKGLLLRLPDGSTAMKHFTESDVRGPKNLASQLRRAGVTSPDDKKPAALPKYITDGTITDKSRQRMVGFLESHDFPTMVFSKDVVEELGMDPSSVNRVLYHCGFQVGETMGRKGRPWYTPETLLALKQKEADGDVIPEEARQIIDGARKAQAEIDALTAPPREPKEVEQMPIYDEPDVVVEKSSFHEGREFIDTHDSWTLDITKMPPTLSLESWLSVLQAAGLEYEIRVWRKR